MRDYTIREIEKITESEAKEMARNKMEYKGYNIYFVELGNRFGYSYLVYKNNKQIIHANDYQLHHSSEKLKSNLYKYYKKSIQYKLFDDKDMEKVKNYNDYQEKLYWLINHKPKEYEEISGFCLPENWEEKEEIKNSWYYYKFNYYKNKNDAEIIDILFTKLYEAYNKMINNKDNLKEAILYEMYNHEYGINYQGDYDVMSLFFNNVNYDKLEESETLQGYMKSIGCNDTQIKAYIQARNEYNAKSNL